MSNLRDIIQSLNTPQLAAAASVSLGENEQSIHKAMDGIIPALLNALLHASSTAHASLSEYMQQASGHPDLSAEVTAGMAMPEPPTEVLRLGKSFCDLLLADRFASVANLTSNDAGIKSSSSSLLFTAASALIAGYLGRKMLAEKLSINSVLTWLGQYQGEIDAAMPGSLTNFNSARVTSHSGEPVAPNLAASETPDATRKKWVFPVILVLLLGIGLFWWMKGCNQSSDETEKSANLAIDSAGASIDDAVNKASTKIDSAVNTVVNMTDYTIGKLDSAGNWIVNKGDSTRIKLANGIEIDAYKGSVEDKLYLFITDPVAMPEEKVWFPFEYVLFEPNKANMKKSAERQIANIAEILKAYPTVKVKLGGFTDNAGDTVKSTKLANARVKAVYDQLIGKGLTKESFDAKPYESFGTQMPIADNTIAEGRAQNRRVAICVTAK